MNGNSRQDTSDCDAFWGWNGRYIGYRSSDCLFDGDGLQVGYFAEGDEVYTCLGKYVGEVRGGNRLITNQSKKSWTRSASTPHSRRPSKIPKDLDAKQMLAGYEDFVLFRDSLTRPSNG